jgi:hypothetical protein
MINENTQINKTYALLAFYDLFGAGYLVQEDEHTAAAIKDGWQVIMSGRTRVEADYAYNLYKNTGKPETVANDLGTLLTYDYTEEVENRDSSVAEEFDDIEIEWNGRVIDGTITFIDETTVELDGFTEIPAAYFLAHATLIAKADADSGFMKTYGAYLDELNQNWNTIYAFATNAQNRQELGEAA